MKFKRNILALGIFSLMVLILSACGGSTSPGTTPTSGDSQNLTPTSRPAPTQVVLSPKEILDRAPLCQEAGQQITITLGVSEYVGWMPWYYAFESGIMQKWGDKCGVEFKLQPEDYIQSVTSYVDGGVDAVVMTNMEALNYAAVAGVDTTAVIVGDYSNGNDAVLTRDGLGLCDLAGKEVLLVQSSVSQYTLERGLEMECKGSVTERDIDLIDTPYNEIKDKFSNGNQGGTVTWNPLLLEILAESPKFKKAFDSSQIPHEILDILFVRTEIVEKYPQVAEALVGAWYETMALMTTKGPERESALRFMAESANITVPSFTRQLETTAMYWNPKDAAEFTRSQELIDAMGLVKRFSSEHGLVDEKDQFGVEFPDKTVQGDSSNVMLRFTDKFMQLAASGGN